MTDYPDELDWPDEDMYDPFEDVEADEFSCDNCGPWCPHWCGDNLCELAIEEHGRIYDDYYENYVTPDVACPVCGKVLTQYDIPIDELWTWPGDFADTIVALDVYAVYSAPKGEYHRSDGVCHVWIGWHDSDKAPNEKLIRLLGKQEVDHDDDEP